VSSSEYFGLLFSHTLSHPHTTDSFVSKRGPPPFAYQGEYFLSDGLAPASPCFSRCISSLRFFTKYSMVVSKVLQIWFPWKR